MPIPVCELHRGCEECDHCKKKLTDTRVNIDLQGFVHNPDEGSSYSIDCDGLSFCDMRCFIRYLESRKYVN